MRVHIFVQELLLLVTVLFKKANQYNENIFHSDNNAVRLMLEYPV